MRLFASLLLAGLAALGQTPPIARVRALADQGRIPEALAELQKLLAARPDAETRFQAGVLLRDLAEQRAAKLGELAPHSAAVHEMNGERYELGGRLSEALAEFREAARREPARPGIHYRIGAVLWRQRELTAAEEELRAELAASAHHAMANLRLGQVLAAANRDAEAIPYLERAAETMPASAEAARELGKAYRKSGRPGDARRVWESLAKSRPADPQVHFLLGGIYRELGEDALARREMDAHRKILESRRSQRK